MAYKEGDISIGLFWIEKYKSYRLRILRYKWGYIFTKYYYIPRQISIEFHDGTVLKKALMILTVLLIFAFVLILLFGLLYSLLSFVHG